MTKIYLGKITGCFGLKGDLKIKSDFERKDLAFKKDNTVLINDEEYLITGYKVHKGFDMIVVNNLCDINLVNHLIGSNVYITRDSLNMGSDYLLSDLIGFEVYDERLLGIVEDIMYNNINKFLSVKGDKNFYIPFVDRYIKSVDLENKKIYTIDGEDLII